MKKILSMLAIAVAMAVSFTGFGMSSTDPVNEEVTTVSGTIEENDTILGTSASWFDSVISVQDSVTGTVVE